MNGMVELKRSKSGVRQGLLHGDQAGDEVGMALDLLGDGQFEALAGRAQAKAVTALDLEERRQQQLMIQDYCG